MSNEFDLKKSDVIKRINRLKILAKEHKELSPIFVLEKLKHMKRKKYAEKNESLNRLINELRET